ncbi:unnamed protein product [Zymoseptoria tritici ST99CH_1A5]|uniref:Uncharacterized protein n=1 Tax=Zymoseptoria tritici ST99CH_1A5 TaxID=1276529 RepID=A0A1Y6M1G9_ZYMTR|nr:unnamed protein product [Zymoseptoria tritici ST99CH_1A5]
MQQFQMDVLETEMSWCNAVFDIEAEGSLRVGVQCDKMTKEDGHGMENSNEIDSSHRPETFSDQKKSGATKESAETAEMTEYIAGLDDRDDSSDSDLAEDDISTGDVEAADEERVSADGSETAERPKFCFDRLITALESAAYPRENRSAGDTGKDLIKKEPGIESSDPEVTLWTRMSRKPVERPPQCRPDLPLFQYAIEHGSARKCGRDCSMWDECGMPGDCSGWVDYMLRLRARYPWEEGQTSECQNEAYDR